ncbi:MAG: terpene cyclase/mutase family protein [Chloroflexi bacterium]|nr:terpene cyclase/mutase family protein [Chloroflexota bacterium]
MNKWLENLQSDPISTLLEVQDEALTFFLRRDLLEEDTIPVEDLWKLPPATNLIKKQKENGSWRYGGQGVKRFPYNNYDLLETFRNLRTLVAMHALTRDHPAIQGAAEYIFSCQAEDGDIRGIIGNQHMPYYHGAILELLIKAGYVEDDRVIKGLDWLLSVRQADGGWLIPMQMIPAKEKTEEYWCGNPLPTDKSKPHAHLATGMEVIETYQK